MIYDFNQRKICNSIYDRSGRTAGGRAGSLGRDCFQAGDIKKYLETVVNLLVKAKLVRGASGKGGGYRLLRKPSEYTVWEILNVTEGTMAPVFCLSENADLCPREPFCKTLPMWKKFDTLVHDFFGNITIEDLVNGDF